MSTLRAVEPDGDLVRRVAEEVRALMARQRVTQTRLAEVLDIPQSSVSARLRGATPFRIPELERLADLFQVHVAAFFGVAAGGPGGPPSPEGVTHGLPQSRSTQRYRELCARLGDNARSAVLERAVA